MAAPMFQNMVMMFLLLASASFLFLSQLQAAVQIPHAFLVASMLLITVSLLAFVFGSESSDDDGHISTIYNNCTFTAPIPASVPVGPAPVPNKGSRPTESVGKASPVSALDLSRKDSSTLAVKTSAALTPACRNSLPTAQPMLSQPLSKTTECTASEVFIDLAAPHIATDPIERNATLFHALLDRLDKTESRTKSALETLANATNANSESINMVGGQVVPSVVPLMEDLAQRVARLHENSLDRQEQMNKNLFEAMQVGLRSLTRALFDIKQSGATPAIIVHPSSPTVVVNTPSPTIAAPIPVVETDSTRKRTVELERKLDSATNALTDLAKRLTQLEDKPAPSPKQELTTEFEFDAKERLQDLERRQQKLGKVLRETRISVDRLVPDIKERVAHVEGEQQVLVETATINRTAVDQLLTSLESRLQHLEDGQQGLVEQVTSNSDVLVQLNADLAELTKLTANEVNQVIADQETMKKSIAKTTRNIKSLNTKAEESLKQRSVDMCCSQECDCRPNSEAQKAEITTLQAKVDMLTAASDAYFSFNLDTEPTTGFENQHAGIEPLPQSAGDGTAVTAEELKAIEEFLRASEETRDTATTVDEVLIPDIGAEGPRTEAEDAGRDPFAFDYEAAGYIPQADIIGQTPVTEQARDEMAQGGDQQTITPYTSTPEAATSLDASVPVVAAAEEAPSGDNIESEPAVKSEPPTNDAPIPSATEVEHSAATDENPPTPTNGAPMPSATEVEDSADTDEEPTIPTTDDDKPAKEDSPGTVQRRPRNNPMGTKGLKSLSKILSVPTPPPIVKAASPPPVVFIGHQFEFSLENVSPAPKSAVAGEAPTPVLTGHQFGSYISRPGLEPQAADTAMSDAEQVVGQREAAGDDPSAQPTTSTQEPSHNLATYDSYMDYENDVQHNHGIQDDTPGDHNDSEAMDLEPTAAPVLAGHQWTGDAGAAKNASQIQVSTDSDSDESTISKPPQNIRLTHIKKVPPRFPVRILNEEWGPEQTIGDGLCGWHALCHSLRSCGFEVNDQVLFETFQRSVKSKEAKAIRKMLGDYPEMKELIWRDTWFTIGQMRWAVAELYPDTGIVTIEQRQDSPSLNVINLLQPGQKEIYIHNVNGNHWESIGPRGRYVFEDRPAQPAAPKAPSQPAQAPQPARNRSPDRRHMYGGLSSPPWSNTSDTSEIAPVNEAVNAETSPKAESDNSPDKPFSDKELHRQQERLAEAKMLADLFIGPLEGDSYEDEPRQANTSVDIDTDLTWLGVPSTHAQAPALDQKASSTAGLKTKKESRTPESKHPVRSSPSSDKDGRDIAGKSDDSDENMETNESSPESARTTIGPGEEQVSSPPEQHSPESTTLTSDEKVHDVPEASPPPAPVKKSDTAPYTGRYADDDMILDYT